MILFSQTINLDTLPECDPKLVDIPQLLANLAKSGQVFESGQRILYLQFKLPGGWQYCTITIPGEKTIHAD